MTFSITYSTDKIAQTRIVKPIHPLLNKKMLAAPGGEIISSTRRSRSGLHLVALHGIDGGRLHVWIGLISGTILNLLQVGDEKTDHNILGIVQTALFPDTEKFIPRKM